MSEPRNEQEWHAQFSKDIAENRIFIYAKGEKNAAMCGFSHRVMEIFNALDVDYQVRNIFSDPNLRPALVSFSKWPTTPQVFIDGQFVGGCDILTEMYQSGELQKLLAAAPKTS